MSNNPTPRSSKLMATDRTGRYSFEEAKGSNMAQLASKIIDFEGDDSELQKLREEFIEKYGSENNTREEWKQLEEAPKVHSVKTTNDRLIDESLPVVTTYDVRIYKVFQDIMNGAAINPSCEDSHISPTSFRKVVNYEVQVIYTEFSTGRRFKANNYTELIKKCKRAGVDSPKTAKTMYMACSSEDGVYRREKQATRNGKPVKTGAIGRVERYMLVQQVELGER